MLQYRPGTINNVECYKPLLDLLEGVYIPASELAARYGYTEVHLCNLRKGNRGWPFVKLESGGVRYNVADIIAAEIANTHGPLTVERVCLALAACTDLSTTDRAIAQAHVRKAFAVG